MSAAKLMYDDIEDVQDFSSLAAQKKLDPVPSVQPTGKPVAKGPIKPPPKVIKEESDSSSDDEVDDYDDEDDDDEATSVGPNKNQSM